MTRQQATQQTTTGTTARVLALTFGGLLVVAVAAVSIGTWQGARPRDPSDAGSASAVNTVSTRASSAADAATTAGPTPARTTYYLVSSEADAAVLREMLAASGGPRPEVGQPPSFSVVLVAGTDAAAHLDAISRPPDTRVVDLRTAGERTTQSSDRTATSDPPDGAIFTVYLVSCPQDAARTCALLDTATSGGLQPAASDLVLVVSSEEELARAHQLITGLREVGQQVQVVDRRGGSGALRAAQVARATQPRLYLVASEAQAQILRAGLEQINASRATLGLPPLDRRVAWVASAEAADRLQEAINDENLMRAERSLPPVSVIDLRPRAPEAGTGCGVAENVREC